MNRTALASLTAGVLGFALLAAGCGGGGTPAGGGGPHTSSAGSLTVASSVAPPTLDLTANAAAAIDEVLDYNVYQHLVELDPKGGVVPVLATHYTTSPDGLTYTFTVRKGVSFSNGDPMTPADVVFSLKRAAAHGSTYPYKLLLADVASVKATGSDTVVVTLTHPDNQFLYNLAGYSNGVVLDPKAVAKMATHPVGTGPYAFASQVSNYDVVLTRNPHYWGQTPKLARVTFRYFASAQAANSALKTGQVQVIDNLSNPSDVSQFKGSGGYRIVSGPTNGKIQLTINNAAGPLRKLAVRQAIAYATDKKSVLATAGAGYGRVIGSDAVPGDPWYTPSVNGTYAYSPSKAKAMLASAGYPHGFSLTMTLPPYGYATTAGPLIQAELRAVGIHASIKNVQFPLWISQVFTHSGFQLTIIDHVEARDITNYANCAYYWKYAGCSRVASMLASASRATSKAAEVSGYRKVVELINAQAVNDWLYNPDQLTVAASDVHGLPGSGLTESFDLEHASVGGSTPASAVALGYTP